MRVSVRGAAQIEQLAAQYDRFAANPFDGFDWASLAPIIASYAEEVFRTEGYGQWPELSPLYARWKEANFPGLNILQLSGAYLAAATEVGAPHNLLETTDDSITFGVEGLDYAYFHETGAGNLPVRQTFGLLENNAQLQRDILDQLTRWVQMQLRGR